MRIQKAIFIVFLLMLPLHFIFAQAKKGSFIPFNDHYSFDQWTTENGLPQNTISKILQSKDGYLWMATYGGLVRFDGSKFKWYDTRTTPGITSDYILNLLSDTSGVVYAFTHSEMIVVRNNRVTVHALPAGSVISATIGSVILYYSADSIYRFESGGFSPFTSFHGEKVLEITSKDNFIYVKTEKAIYKLIGKTPVLFYKEERYRDSKNILLAHDSVIKKLLETKTQPPLKGPVIDKFGPGKRFSLGGRELFWETPKGMVIERDSVYYTCFPDDGFPAIHISTIFQDKDGNIWIGTVDFGIFRLKSKTMRTYSEKDGFTTPSVYFVYEDGKKNIYTGFYDIYRKTKSNTSFEKIPRLGFYCSTMIEDSLHRFWFGTLLGRILIYDSNFEFIKELEGAWLQMGRINCLMEDASGNILAGGECGIYQFPRGDYNVGRVVIDSGKYTVYQFCKRGNTVLAATSQGILILKNGKVSKIDKSNGLPDNEVRTVYIDKHDVFWAGTARYGLVQVRNGRVFSFPYGVNLVNENVWTILEDSRGYFWMASNNGLYRAKRSELQDYADGKVSIFNVTRFGTNDGISNSEFNSRTQNKGFISADGDVWLSSMGGAVFLKPTDIADHTSDQHIIVESIDFDDKEHFPGLIKEIPYGKEIRIQFSYPFYNYQGSLKFEYLIDRPGEVWKSLADQRQIVFELLPPGNYTILIRLVGTNRTTAVSFSVTAPYYKTWWFQILQYLLPSILLFYFLYIFLRRRESLRTKRIIQKQQLAELEMKALNAQMNPHFVFNCLSSIQYLFMKKDFAQANEYLKRFSNLLRNLIEHIRSERVSLAEEISFLENYIILENLQFDHPFEYSITTDQEIDPEKVFIPGIFLQPYVENAIKHGLKKQKEKKGELTITFTKEKNGLTCRIKDNGPGRDAAKADHEKQAHISRATSISTDVSGLWAELKNMQIKIEYHDLKDSNGKGTGTEVEITLIYSNI